MRFDPTKPVQTRDGRPARIVCTDLKRSEEGETILALVLEDGDDEQTRSYFADGSYVGGYPSRHDLVNVPVKHIIEQWVNVYPNNRIGPFFYSSRLAADRTSAHDRIACVHVRQEFTEGEGL